MVWPFKVPARTKPPLKMPDWTDPRGPFNAARFDPQGAGLQLRAAQRQWRLNGPLIRLGLATGIEAAIDAASQHERKQDMTRTSPLNAYAVKERGKDKKAFWTRIGRAWPHKSGTGFNLELEALPVDGRIVPMPPKESQAPAETFEADVG
jgi:hypothetical protein